MPHHLVSRIDVRHERDPRLSVLLELTASADPALPLVPGQTVDFSLSLTPSGIGFRFYGYLHEASFSAVADIENVQGLGHMEKQRRYGTYTRSNRGRSVSFTLRVKDHVPAGATLCPELSGGIIDEEGAKLSGCQPLGGIPFGIHSLTGPVLSLTVPPVVGTVIDLNPVDLGPGARVIGVSNAGRGYLSLGPDGTVTYFPPQDQTGPDRFGYLLDFQGHTLHGTVDLMIADPYAAGYPGGGFAAQPQQPQQQYAQDYGTPDAYGSLPYNSGHHGSH